MDKVKRKELEKLIAAARKRNDEFGETPEGKALDARMEFARNLIALLKTHKVNQADFSRSIGMKPAQFNRIVQADENVTLPTIKRIADGFGVPMARLFKPPRKSPEPAGAGR
jgi:antitoxin component HigA of HigAB toxin-antitoxin module